jgi:phosphoribosylamine--glycine ligase
MGALARTPRRILLVGGGGREHALAVRLAGEPGVAAVVALPGSDAIAGVRGASVVAGDPGDAPGVVAAARAAGAELAVIGPEAPLAAGVADALAAAGIPTFGPTAAAARIESSKAFCHAVADAAGVRMARARAFDATGPALAFAAELWAGGRGVVIKADGLAAGKGVTVCDTLDEAALALGAIFAGARAEAGGAPRVVVEERLRGPEASVIVLADETAALALPATRDHKRLGDGDAGPNTGGMGAYSPLPDLPDAHVAAIVEAFHRPLLAELARRGTPFRGALYAGLILTQDGPALLECNARFGDPEAQVMLPRLATPLAPLLLAAAEGRLAAAASDAGITGFLLPATADATVGIVLAAGGYPDAPRSGAAIAGLREAEAGGGLVFHAGTARDASGAWRVHGGRVLTVVGRGPNLGAARRVAERAANAVTFEGLQRRHDIATGPLATRAAVGGGAGRPVAGLTAGAGTGR